MFFGWEGGKKEGKKTHLFSWKEKWEDRKFSLYKFTLMSLFPLFEKLKHYMYYSLSYYYVYYIFFKMKHWEKKAYNMDHEQSERRKKKSKKRER